MPTVCTRRRLRAGFALVSFVFAAGCREPRSERRPLRASLARFSEGQEYARCEWNEPSEGRLLALPACGGRLPRPSADPAAPVVRGPGATTEDLQYGRRRAIAAADVAGLAAGIQALKRERYIRPDDADLENDFAAAFLRLAEIADDSYSLFFALERLLDERQGRAGHASTLFNRAVAWDLLGVTREAARAWEDFLAIEGDSPWAGEAGARVAVLRRTAAEPDAAAGLRRPAGLSAARGRVFEVVLPAWAEAVNRGDPAAARRALDEARAIGRALSDSLTIKSLAVIEAAAARGAGAELRALAEAHRLLGRGIAARRNYDLDRAVTALAEAGRRLTAAGSPAALLAGHHRAMAVYNADRYQEAEALLGEVAAAAAERDEPLIAGLSTKALGVIAQTAGRPDRAVTLYRHALAEVRRAGDRPESAAVASILADGLLAAGRDKEAWRTLHEALRDAWRVAEPRPRYVVSAAGAAMADKRGFTNLAIELNRLSLDAVRGDGSPAAVIDAATWYAESLAASGRLAEASAVLRQVEPLIDHLDDHDVRRRSQADLGCVEGRRLLAAGRPAAALPRVRSAAEYYEEVGLLIHAAPCRAAEGTALLGLGDAAEAVRVLEGSLGLARRLDGALPRPETYYGASDPTLALLDSALALYLARGEPWPALRLASIALERTFPWLASGESDDAVSVRGLETAAPRLSRSGRVVLLVYPLPDGVVAWRLDGGPLAVHRTAIGRPRLAAAIHRFVEALQREDCGAARTLGAALGADLLGDLLRGVNDGKTLVVVTTSELSALPWGLLGSGAGTELLIERWPIAMAPDLRSALEEPAARPVGSGLLVVANPAAGADHDAPPLPSAEREAAFLAELFPGDVTALIGERASKHRVLEEIGDFGSVHMGVHGIANPYAPRASYLLLGGDDGEAHPLTVDEILGIDLEGTGLVVLAACSSSLRSTALATNALGLGEAFLAAGADSVVASAWAVGDEETGRLMTDFYRALAGGAPVAGALRAAQLAALDRSPSGCLRESGAFRLLGDPAVHLNVVGRTDAR